MNLVRLTYASRLKKKLNHAALEKIMDVSRRNNRKLGVTGALCSSPRGFLQILEGPPEAVNELYNRIVRDPRHADVTLLEYVRVPFREFENWSMAYIRTDEIAQALLHKYSTHRVFDPFTMGPTQARVFLLAITELRAHFLAKQHAGGSRSA
ncbi:MAG: BLUF domain-containing protein [Kiritimatiellia bacterium]